MPDNKPVREEVPQFRKNVVDVTIQNKNNATLWLGVDRPPSGSIYTESAPLNDGDAGTGTIDVVTGRSNRDPNYYTDKSRIYVSSKTKGDTNFGLKKVDGFLKEADTTIEESEGGHAYIVAKSDSIRLIARDDVRIQTVGIKEPETHPVSITDGAFSVVEEDKIYIKPYDVIRLLLNFDKLEFEDAEEPDPVILYPETEYTYDINVAGKSFKINHRPDAPWTDEKIGLEKGIIVIEGPFQSGEHQLQVEISTKGQPRGLHGQKFIGGLIVVEEPEEVKPSSITMKSNGDIIIHSENNIRFGSETANDPTVLSSELTELLYALIGAIFEHQHMDAMGRPTSAISAIGKSAIDKLTTIQANLKQDDKGRNQITSNFIWNELGKKSGEGE